MLWVRISKMSILSHIPNNLLKSPPCDSVGPCCVYSNYTAHFFSAVRVSGNPRGMIPNQSRIVAHSASPFLQTVTEWRKSFPLRCWGLYLPQARNWEFGSEPRAFKISNLTISGRVGCGSVFRIVPAHPHFPSHRLHFACAPLSLSALSSSH